VNLGKIGKKLKREAANSPGKAAVLGLVCLVAIYFWAPLLYRWTVKSGDATTASAPDVAAMPSSAIAATTPGAIAPGAPANSPNAAESSQPSTDWQTTLQQIETDPDMKPAVYERELEPFAGPPAEGKSQVADLDVSPAPVAEKVTPGSLGITLVGTLVGPERRAARIGGKTLLVGQTIEVVKGTERYQFTLTDVQRDRVVLMREGERFELRVKPSAPAGRIEWTPHP